MVEAVSVADCVNCGARSVDTASLCARCGFAFDRRDFD